MVLAMEPRADAAPSDRELEILRLYLELGSVKRVAWRLHETEGVVKRQMANLRAKVGASTTAEVVFVLYERLRIVP